MVGRAKLLAASGLMALVTGGGAAAQAETVRATQLGAKNWARIARGEAEDLTVEFREGDRLPLNVRVGGHFAETTEPAPVWITVKRGFFLRFEPSKILLSIDGENFAPFDELATGRFNVGFNADEGGGVVQGAEIGLDAWLRDGSLPQ